MSNNTNQRVAFIDYIRVIACFLVILVHSSESFYAADSSGLAGNMSMLANESNRFWVAFYDGFLARICVPLFMIISAFLLVPMRKGASMTSFYKSRFSRILPPMIIFMLAYSFLPLLWDGMSWEQSIRDFKLLPWNFPSMAGHLWFMYPLISLYLIIPVVSPWLERSKAKEELIFIGLFIVSCFIPWIQRFIAPEIWGECFWNKFSMLWYFSGYLGYLVLAHYIRFHLNWTQKKRLIVGSVCLLSGALFTGWSFWQQGVPGVSIDTPTLEWAWEFCTPNVLCATFGAFILFTCIKQAKTPKIIASISEMSFGIYLMHMFFLSNIAPLFIQGDVTNPIIPVYLAIPGMAILTFVCCVATSKLISYHSYSNYIIGTNKKGNSKSRVAKSIEVSNV
ncbi:MAG: acyltransferase [Bacteroidales bacterium]